MASQDIQRTMVRSLVDHLHEHSEETWWSSESELAMGLKSLLKSVSNSTRGRALFSAASGMKELWLAINALVMGHEHSCTLKELLIVLKNLCQDHECADNWGLCGGHRLIQKLMAFAEEEEETDTSLLPDENKSQENDGDDQTWSYADIACEIVALSYEAEVPFPMRFLKESQVLQTNSLCSYWVQYVEDEGREDSGGERCHEILFRPVKKQQESMYTVGFKLWSAAIVLSNWIVENRARFRGRRVLEVGAGLGLCGLAAALFAEEVIITDFNPIINANIQKNIELNQQSGFSSDDDSLAVNNPERFQSAFLDWTVFSSEKFEESSDLDPKLQGRKFDIVIASDMVYQQADADGVAMATKHFLADEGEAYFVVPHPDNRYGVQHLPSSLQEQDLISLDNSFFEETIGRVEAAGVGTKGVGDDRPSPSCSGRSSGGQPRRQQGRSSIILRGEEGVAAGGGGTVGAAPGKEAAAAASGGEPKEEGGGGEEGEGEGEAPGGGQGPGGWEVRAPGLLRGVERDARELGFRWYFHAVRRRKGGEGGGETAARRPLWSGGDGRR